MENGVAQDFMGTGTTDIIGVAAVDTIVGMVMISVCGGSQRGLACFFADFIILIIILPFITRMCVPTLRQSSGGGPLPGAVHRYRPRPRLGITAPQARPITLTLRPVASDGRKCRQFRPMPSGELGYLSIGQWDASRLGNA